jgi:hypothetical protein
VKRDYARLLNIELQGQQITLKDPLKLTDWQSEQQAVPKWPPCMYINVAEYLLANDQRDLLDRLKNDYKEGETTVYAIENAFFTAVHFQEKLSAISPQRNPGFRKFFIIQWKMIR